MSEPRYIVQIGYDTTPFKGDAFGDVVKRHDYYGQRLKQLRPGSRITQLMLEAPSGSTIVRRANTIFIPIQGGRLRACIRLLGYLYRLQKRRRIDVITTQTLYEEGWIAALFGALFKVPVVGQEHNESAAAENYQGHFLKRYLLSLRRRGGEWLAGRVAGVRAVSPVTAADLKRAAPHARIEVIPVPVTITQASPVREEARGPHVLFVGRLAPQKNVGIWLAVAARILAQIPEAKFEIAGDGPLRADLEKEAERLRLGHAVTFHGKVRYEDLPEIYARSRVLLLPSLYEGFGRVIIEALTFGVAVVASKTAGPQYILGSVGERFLHAPHDIDGMTASVLTLLQDERERLRMVADSAGIIERFSLPALTQRWLEFLLDIADSHQR